MPNITLTRASTRDKARSEKKPPVLVATIPPIVAAKLHGMSVKLVKLKFTEKYLMP